MFTRIPVVSQKNLLLVLALGCFGIVGGGVVLQQVFALVPCPLCIAERICFGLCGVVALVAYIFPPRMWWHELFLFLGIEFFAVVGAGITWRQLMLASHPKTTDVTCAFFPSFFERMLAALGGVGDCSDQTWTLLHLSLPQWALLFFVGIMLYGVGLLAWSRFQLVSK